MIDPKLNEIPASGSRSAGSPVTEVSEEERLRRRRAGLSISDTVAGDVNMSVGSRGVDTSGVGSGAGAGAGMTVPTPGRGDGSPAPNIVPGARGSGTTLRSDANTGQTPTVNLDRESSKAGATSVAAETGFDATESDLIAARAYECWYERGCPHGSPEVDWQRAEDEIRARRSTRASAATAL